MTELFHYLNQQPDPLHPGARIATVNIAALEEVLQLPDSGEAPSQLHINLPDSLTLHCQTASVQRFDDRSAAWRGILPGFPDTSVHLGIKFTEHGVRLSGLAVTTVNEWHISPGDKPSGV